MGVYQENFSLSDYPEELIDKIISYRMNPYGITMPYPDYAEIAALEHLTPDEVRLILSATAIIWGH
jgi:hypothetical protein